MRPLTLPTYHHQRHVELQYPLANPPISSGLLPPSPQTCGIEVQRNSLIITSHCIRSMIRDIAHFCMLVKRNFSTMSPRTAKHDVSRRLPAHSEISDLRIESSVGKLDFANSSFLLPSISASPAMATAVSSMRMLSQRMAGKPTLFSCAISHMGQDF